MCGEGFGGLVVIGWGCGCESRLCIHNQYVFDCVSESFGHWRLTGLESLYQASMLCEVYNILVIKQMCLEMVVVCVLCFHVADVFMTVV
jgi:hypothetical protein